jgi:hypothetical protein
MKASIEHLRTDAAPFSNHRPLRLQLNDTMGDGTWWPRSRDPNIELPDLVDNFPQHFGQIDHIVFARPDWETAPRQVRVHRGLLEVDPYERETANQVLLAMTTRREIALVVTPPEEPSSAGTGAPSTLNKGAPDIESEDPDAVLLWTDAGDTWWEYQAGAPSLRS